MSRLEQRPGCGYKQEQMANSCCPLSCQGPEDLSANKKPLSSQANYTEDKKIVLDGKE